MFVFVKKKLKTSWLNKSFNFYSFGDIFMKCRMCGYEFDENNVPNRGCSGCGKHGCQSVHCPNCGFGNSPELDEEFDFIIKLKDKIRNIKKASH